MEQVQTTVAKPAKQKKPVGLQVAAFVLGLLGSALAFLLYFGAITRVVFSVVAVESGIHAYQGAGISIVVLCVLVCLVCIVGIVLGIVGLVKSIRRATRTVKGIIFSAIGLDFAAAGLVFAVLSIVFSGVLSVLLPQLIQSFH